MQHAAGRQRTGAQQEREIAGLGAGEGALDDALAAMAVGVGARFPRYDAADAAQATIGAGGLLLSIVFFSLLPSYR